MLLKNPLFISKVLLINLPEDGQCADFYTPSYAIEHFSIYPPLGLLYVATASKDNYPVEIMDVVALRYGIKETITEIIRRAPVILGISCTTFRLYPMVEIIRGVKAKFPNLVVVVGGPHTSLYPVETINLPGVDYVIVGDGEYSFKKLLNALSKGDINELNNIKGLVFNDGNKIVQVSQEYETLLENLPFPDRKLLNYNYYYTAADKTEQVVTMISSRGCPFGCTFCDVQEKKYRWRPAKDVVNEMEHISNTFSNPVIHIFDDTFNLKRDRALEICSEIKRRNLKIKWTTRARVHPFDEEMIAELKSTGLKRIHFGVESGSETTLKNINKGINKRQIANAFSLCSKYKIDTVAYFIIGFEGEKGKDIEDTINFIKEIRPTFVMANTLYPAAKTGIYKELLRKEKIREDLWQKFVSKPVRDFKLPQWQNNATRNYLKRKLDEIYLQFYLSASFVLNNVSSDVKEGFSFSQILFKAALAFRILKSYITNLVIEKININGDKNEIC